MMGSSGTEKGPGRVLVALGCRDRLKGSVSIDEDVREEGKRLTLTVGLRFIEEKNST
ncbi:MAG: hypothetical protein Q9N34_07550 [Aquificota bacterium]|nr:hypothetical protein [Aquificota bacterium]